MIPKINIKRPAFCLTLPVNNSRYSAVYKQYIKEGKWDEVENNCVFYSQAIEEYLACKQLGIKGEIPYIKKPTSTKAKKQLSLILGRLGASEEDLWEPDTIEVCNIQKVNKKIMHVCVTDNCNGCGLCIVNGSSYLRENDEGNAEPIEGKFIGEDDETVVNQIVEECPQHALYIAEILSTNKTGQEGIADIVSCFKEKISNFKVKRVAESDVRLDINDYTIPAPDSDKTYRRDYNSENQARSAARDEFRNLCYSEKAYRPMIKKVFVDYKVKVLKPYYTCEDKEGNVYYSYNQEIRRMLANVYSEICNVSEHKCELPESWKNFSVYLFENDRRILTLKNFDDNSTCSGIIADFKERGEYTSLDWYVNNDMSYDCDEMYEGETIFGNPKYKKKWYFYDFWKAVEDFVKDLRLSINSMSSDIENLASINVNSALEDFEETVKKVLQQKFEELEKYVDSI